MKLLGDVLKHLFHVLLVNTQEVGVRAHQDGKVSFS